jgi:hypothetical protein
MNFPPEISKVIHFLLLDYYYGGGTNEFEYGETEVSRHRCGLFEMMVTHSEVDGRNITEGFLIFKTMDGSILLGTTEDLNKWDLTIDGNNLQITYDDALFRIE